MTNPQQARRYRFGVFEADGATGELRRQGVRIKLNLQPFQVLLMLLERPGEVLSREEIARMLWPDGTFVDYEHGVSSAVNRIREALGDKAKNPRFIETLARRGYRFAAPVQRIAEVEDPPHGPSETVAEHDPIVEKEGQSYFLASPDELPKTPHRTVQTLFVLLQVMYIGFYVGALANLPEIRELFSLLSRPRLTLGVLIVTAVLLIQVRMFVLCAVLLRAPRIRGKLLKMWPFLLPFVLIWSLAPFLLLHHIDFGLALACMAPLVYSPFAQRSLILMGAGEAG